MLGENKVLIYERMFSLTETCKTQSNHQAHEIIIPQLSQCHTVAHRILRWSMRLLHLMTLVCCFSLCYQLLAKNNIDQEYNRVKISFFLLLKSLLALSTCLSVISFCLPLLYNSTHFGLVLFWNMTRKRNIWVWETFTNRVRKAQMLWKDMNNKSWDFVLM